MDLREMKMRKKEMGYTNARLAEVSGVPLGTVQRILSGETKNPRHEAWSALVRALSPSEHESSYITGAKDPSYVKEAEAAYGKRQGEYTAEDYFGMPDDVRVELIDGVIYDMTPAPSLRHQDIAGNIYAELLMHVRSKGGPCRPFIAPVDVRLDGDDKTVMQPDVAVVCSSELISGGRVISGAPDLICEVLSPSTKKKDLTVKYRKYLDAGVREYWVIDPGKMQILTYFFEDDLLPVIYSFNDKVPVRIWDEDSFSIDFSGIAGYISE